jgi:hypothetical protein
VERQCEVGGGATPGLFPCASISFVASVDRRPGKFAGMEAFDKNAPLTLKRAARHSPSLNAAVRLFRTGHRVGLNAFFNPH